jgi:uncharacterized protein YkwD
MSRRTLTRLAALPLAAAALTLPAAAAPAAAPCAGDAAAIICAVNAQRAANGLPAVGANRSLAAVARAHSASMVARHKFSHGNFGRRVARTAWARRRGAWAAGEALAWGTGAPATPAATVAAWMQSPEHRRIVLDPRYRVVGVGEAAGVPVAGVDGADGRTYTADFGT